MGNYGDWSLAVVIPCYKVTDSIVSVVMGIPEFVKQIVVVDDACPDGSGKLVESQVSDPRVSVIYNPTNLGVGGAVIRGYQHLLAETDPQVVVKVDGDGQMDPSHINSLISPILREEADHAKGNRFDSLEDLEQMPKISILENIFGSAFILRSFAIAAL